jgi:hypothetical protein
MELPTLRGRQSLRMGEAQVLENDVENKPTQKHLQWSRTRMENKAMLCEGAQTLRFILYSSWYSLSILKNSKYN